MEVGNNPPSTARPGATLPPAPPARGGDDRLLGSLAVREGHVSAQQVEECVALQKQGPAPRKLGEILIEKGYITPKRLASILDIQSRQVHIVAADPARGGLFGQIALDLGFVPGDKIEQALQEQATLSRSGSPAMLGQILLRKGWLQTGQFLEILKVQRRAILRCPGCDTFYRFQETDRGAKFACRRCGTIVPIPAAEPEEPRAGKASSIPAKPTAESGAQFGRYAIQEELGRGGMGIVYKALHKDLNTVFALKILRETEVSSAEVLDRFKREAQAEARLRHPNIVSIHDAGQEAGVHYLAMDYIEGDPLTTHLARAFKVRDMIARFEKVVRAVHHAHEQGIIHRDLKPANIMIDLAGEPHIMDFGLAKFLDDPKRIMLTKDGSFLGTPYYMAPEQIRGEAQVVGPRSDVYSLGVILYEILCGRTPHVAQNSVEIFHKILSEEPPPPRLFNTRIHPDLQTICLKAIEKESTARYMTAGEFADDLRRYLDGEPIMARLQPWPILALRRLRKNKSAALAAISILLFAISGGLVYHLVSKDAREFERLKAEATRSFDDRDYQQALIRSQAALRLRPDDKGMKDFVDWVTDRIRKQGQEFQDRLAQDEKRREAEPRVAAARTMLDMIPRQLELDAAGIVKRAAEVEKLLDEALKIVADHEEALHNRARARMLRGDWEGALEDFAKVLSKAPGRVESRYQAARLRLARVIEARLADARPAGVPPGRAFAGERKRAHAEFSEVWANVARDPARDEFSKAALRWLDGKDTEAAGGLDTYVVSYPADPDAWRLRAMARTATGDPAGAESDLSTAARYGPADAAHRLARAWVRHGRANAAGADEDLAAAAELAPRSLAPALLRGRILMERGDFAAAAEAFAAAAERDAGSAAAALGGGLARLRRTDFEGALTLLARAAELDPDDAWPPLLKSEALEGLDRGAEALEAAEAAVGRAAESAVVYERRGRVLVRLERWADAVKDLEKAITLDPSSGPRLDAALKAAKERAHGKP
jgi:serine/threonine protein kinase/Flp pilus assembly protein TadD